MFSFSFRKRSRGAQVKKAALGMRPLLEQLEDRVVPSATLLADINALPLSSVSSSASFTEIQYNGNVYFPATNGTATELYSTDGSHVTKVTSIATTVTGSGVSATSPLAVVNNEILFTANDGVSGTQVWETNGTAAGTVRVTNINSPTGIGLFPIFNVLNNHLYFVAYTSGTTDPELYATDGTAYSGGTGINATKVTNFYGNNSSATTPFTTTETAAIANGKLFFGANDGAHGYELWETDGTNTNLVSDINPGTGSALTPSALTRGSLVEYNNGSSDRLYFAANNGQTNGYQLYSTDGTTTTQVSNVTGNGQPGGNFFGAVYNGYLYYVGNSGGSPSTSQLYRTNGNTTSLFTVNPTGSAFLTGSTPSFTVFDGKLYFEANNGTSGQELFSMDGTTVSNVADIVSGANSSSPTNLTVVGTGTNARLYFSANDGTNGQSLFVYDGINPPQEIDSTNATSPASPKGILDFNGTALFAANALTTGTISGTNYSVATVQLLESNGTAAGTGILQQINQGSQSSNAAYFDSYNGETYFFANDGANGTELWETDGTADGTKLLANVNPPAGVGNSSTLANAPFPLGVTANGNLFFRANTAAGSELWVLNTNNPSAGATAVTGASGTPTTPGGIAALSYSNPTFSAVVGNNLFFYANNGSTTGVQLWETDGTSANTHIVDSVNPGTGNSVNTAAYDYPIAFTPSGSSTALVYFIGTNNGTNYQVYSTDGTSADTTLVTGTFAADTGVASAPDNLTVFNGRVYFYGNNGSSYQLWSTSTANGSDLVATPSPNNFASPTAIQVAHTMAVSNNRLYYIANNGSGQYVYSIANDTDTPVLAGGGKSPAALTPFGTGLYFYGNNGTSNQLYFTNGTTAAQLTSFSSATNISSLTVVGNELFFTANDAAHGTELWHSDGTVQGTALDTDVYPGPTSGVTTVGGSQYLAALGNQLIFSGNDRAHGVQLWQETLTRTALSIAPNPTALATQNETLVATVAQLGPVGNGIVTSGTVAFFDGTTQLGQATVQGGVAYFTTTTPLAVGSHSLTAQYQGDGTTTLGLGLAPSTSTAVTETVTAAPFQVDAFTFTANGFSAAFDAAPTPASVVTTGSGADVSLVDTTSGATVTGSVAFDCTGTLMTFVATNGALNPGDSYKITLTGGTGGLTDAGGDVFATTTQSFLAATPAATLSVPGFGAAAGSTVSPDGTGLPFTLANAANVTSVTFTLSYNASLLTLPASFTPASGLAVRAIQFAGSGPYSSVTLTITSSTSGAPLTTASAPLVLGDFVGATVPTSATGSGEVLTLTNLTATVASGTAPTVTPLDGIQSLTASNPAPTLTSISPPSAAVGSSATTITLTGSNFVSSSTADFNGTALSTTYVSATALTAVIPAADLTTAASASVTVVNAGPGGGTSGSVTFTVTPISTTTTLTDNGPNPSYTGVEPTVTVTVTPASGSPIPGETVSVYDSTTGTTVGTGTLTNGTATFALTGTLASGANSLYAVYAGDSTHGGSNSSPVTQTVTSTFQVNGWTANSDGVFLTFDAPVAESSVVLYSQSGGATPDFTFTDNTTSSVVKGSLVVDPTNPYLLQFIPTAGALTSGSYTLAMTTGVQSTTGVSLGAYSNTQTVTASSAPALSIPSFARGPGQAVNVPASATTGIPITISGASTVTAVAFTLTYDPSILTIAGTGAITLSSGASSAGLTASYTPASTDAHHASLTVTVNGGTWNAGTSGTPLLYLTASVPNAAVYLNKGALNLINVSINGSTAQGVSGVDEDAYVGDVTGAESYTALDAATDSQVSNAVGTGFNTFQALDPSIIGDTSGQGSGAIVALDAAQISQAGNAATVLSIPSIPSTATPTPGGADPILSFQAAAAAPGQATTVHILLDVTAPSGITLAALDYAIQYDATFYTPSNVVSGGGSAAITSASENGTTVTVTTATAVTDLAVGDSVFISGVSVGGSTANSYNGTFTVTSMSGDTFTYTAASGLGSAAVTGASAGAGLAGLGGYSSSGRVYSSADLIFASSLYNGSGTYATLPHGAILDVLDFTATVAAGEAAGATTPLTLLASGTYNGVTKTTAVYDADNALVLDPAPSNTGFVTGVDNTLTVPGAPVPSQPPVGSSPPVPQAPASTPGGTSSVSAGRSPAAPTTLTGVSGTSATTSGPNGSVLPAVGKVLTVSVPTPVTTVPVGGNGTATVDAFWRQFGSSVSEALLSSKAAGTTPSAARSIGLTASPFTTKNPFAYAVGEQFALSGFRVWSWNGTVVVTSVNAAGTFPFHTAPSVTNPHPATGGSVANDIWHPDTTEDGILDLGNGLEASALNKTSSSDNGGPNKLGQ